MQSWSNQLESYTVAKLRGLKTNEQIIENEVWAKISVRWNEAWGIDWGVCNVFRKKDWLILYILSLKSLDIVNFWLRGRFPSLSWDFLLNYTMILQRIWIIVGDAGSNPEPLPQKSGVRAMSHHVSIFVVAIDNVVEPNFSWSAKTLGCSWYNKKN